MNSERIQRNNALCESLKKTILRGTDRSRLFTAAEFIGSCRNANASGVYCDTDLENLLNRLAGTIPAGSFSESSNGKILHVMTTAESVGGHTRVAENLIRLLDRPASVFLTRQNGMPIPPWLEDAVHRSGGTLYAPQEPPFLCAEHLRDSASAYDAVFLHINNFDGTANLAFSGDFPRPIFFLNHSDHNFSLGFTIADAVFELSSEGCQFSRERRGVRSPVRLPIPLNLPRKEQYRRSGRVVSMASAYKFNPIEGYHFPQFCEKLLSAFDRITIEIIGVSPDNPHWESQKAQFPDRLNLHGPLPREKVESLMDGAELYIDSFPFTSTMGTLETAMRGIPVISLKTPMFVMDSLIPATSGTVEQLFAEASRILTGTEAEVRRYIEKIQDAVESDHGRESVVRIIEGTLASFKTHCPETDTPASPRFDEYDAFIDTVLDEGRFVFSAASLKKFSPITILKITAVLMRFGELPRQLRLYARKFIRLAAGRVS